MLRRILLLGFVLASACAMSQTKMKVLLEGERVGSGTYMHQIRQDGTLFSKLTFSIDAFGNAAQFQHETVRNKDGSMNSGKSVTKTASATETRVLTFSGAGVTVKTTANGATKTAKSTAPKGASLKEASAFWFLRDKPKKGATETHYSYNPDTGKWDKSTVKYLGEETIQLNGKKVIAHAITHTKGKAWLDSKGLPYRILVSMDGGISMTIERA